MPVYEYACTQCNTKFEQVRSVRRRNRIEHCPECGHPSKRVPSAPVLQTNPGIKLRKKLDKKKAPEGP